MNNTISENSGKAVRFTLQKNERLCSKKTIDKLFAEGKAIFVFPLKIVFLESENFSEVPVQAGFAVSKKNFKRAVKRNMIKRRMREAYRLNKPAFYEELKETQLALFFVFTAKEIADFDVINSAVKKGMKKIVKEVSSKAVKEG